MAMRFATLLLIALAVTVAGVACGREGTVGRRDVEEASNVPITFDDVVP